MLLLNSRFNYIIDFSCFLLREKTSRGFIYKLKKNNNVLIVIIGETNKPVNNAEHSNS